MAKGGQVIGLEACLRNIDTVQKKFEDRGAKALEDWGKKTIDESKNDFCPVDSGVMRATGNIQMNRSGSRVEVILYYNTDYAPAVHEKPAYHVIGQSGFLRIPFTKNSGLLDKMISSAIGGIL